MMGWEVLGKVIGAVLILSGCVAYGLSWWREWDQGCKELEDLKQVLIALARDQAYMKEPLPELCTRLFDTKTGEVANKTKELGRDLMMHPFSEAWGMYVDGLWDKLHYSMGLQNQLIGLGESLQGMDGVRLQLRIQGCLELLNEELTLRRGQLKDKKKVAMSCCVMAGLFAVIILA